MFLLYNSVQLLHYFGKGRQENQEDSGNVPSRSESLDKAEIIQAPTSGCLAMRLLLYTNDIRISKTHANEAHSH